MSNTYKDFPFCPHRSEVRTISAGVVLSSFFEARVFASFARTLTWEQKQLEISAVPRRQQAQDRQFKECSQDCLCGRGLELGWK